MATLDRSLNAQGCSIDPTRGASMALTMSEVCAEMRTSRSTLNGWIRRYKLPARKVGGRVLILRSDLNTWLASQPGYNVDPRKG